MTPFLVATPLARHWPATAGAGRDVESLDRVFRALAMPAQPVAVAVAALLATLLIGTALQSDRFAPVAASTPEVAVQAALRAGVIGPVLNSYRFGGYLIYIGLPVFIDGRADMYGDTMVKRQLDVVSLGKPEDLSLLLEDYRIGWTLLESGTPALALIDRMPGWRRIHADEVAVVHVRVGGSAAR